MNKVKVCASCKQEKDISDYRTRFIKKSSKIYQYLNFICKSCDRAKCRKYYKDKPHVSRNWKEKNRSNIKVHVYSRLKQWTQKSGLPISDLDSTYLIDLYNKQEGKCFYTSREMIIGGKRGELMDNFLSLDRINPSLGYIKGNVVWCCYLINTMKGNHSKEDFFSLINLIIAKDNNKSII